tara:strand:+ start:288 stop:671 length:384 start_codon:yes stop_codon:yes gene_type:complete
MKNLLITISRIFLGLYFLLAGVAKFLSWDTHISLMEVHNIEMSTVLLAIAGGAQVLGGICLIFNKYVVVCALGLAIMVLIINLNLHDFWNIYEGVDVKHETQNFIKNLGLIIAFLLLAASNMKDSRD